MNTSVEARSSLTYHIWASALSGTAALLLICLPNLTGARTLALPLVLAATLSATAGLWSAERRLRSMESEIRSLRGSIPSRKGELAQGEPHSHC